MNGEINTELRYSVDNHIYIYNYKPPEHVAWMYAIVSESWLGVENS